ncbi:MAG: efflux RND transporter periplasmic adaptor subunit [Pirellulaceae bacterium]
MIRFAFILAYVLLTATPGRSQSLDAFTEPVKSVRVATVEAGRIDALHVKRGQSVAAGAELVRLDAELLEVAAHIAAAEAADDTHVRQLEIDLNANRERLTHIDDLNGQGAVSPEEVRQAKLKVAVAELELEAARNRLLRAKLKNEEAAERLKRRVVCAPFDGIIVDITRETGEYLSMAEPHIVTLVQLHQLRATFFVPTHAAIQFRAGDHVQVALEESQTPVMAEVEYVAALTESDSGRVRVDVLIDNQDFHIRAGLRVRLDLPATVATLSRTRAVR